MKVFFAKLLIYKFVLLLLLCVAACNLQLNDASEIIYNFPSVSNEINKQKPLLLYVYKPYNCVSCNSLVAMLYEDSSLSNQLGRNFIWLFDGIRNVELAEYQEEFRSYLGYTPLAVNDKEVFKKVIENDAYGKFRNMPAYCILIKHKKVCFFNLKDIDVLNQIKDKIAH